MRSKKEYNEICSNDRKKHEDAIYELRSSASEFERITNSWLVEYKEDKKSICRRGALCDFYEEFEKFKDFDKNYFESTLGRTGLCRLTGRKNVIAKTVARWDLSVPYPKTKIIDQCDRLDSVIVGTGTYNIIPKDYFREKRVYIIYFLN